MAQGQYSATLDQQSAEIIKKIAAERQWSVSQTIANLIRDHLVCLGRIKTKDAANG